MKQLTMLSTITSTIVEDTDNNTLTFLVNGKQVTRKINSKYFSNWGIDTVRVDNVMYQIDESRMHHLVKSK
ncbi:MAG: hypothetical protein [Caudoviricetes sp.]|nr:MAG: hypothetical protein [Caudoviricetes sp.]